MIIILQTNGVPATGAAGGGVVPAPAQQPQFMQQQQQWFPPPGPGQNYYNPPGNLHSYIHILVTPAQLHLLLCQ